MRHFRYITTHFTLCFPGHHHTHVCQWGKAFPVEGIEWIGTGLAIQHVFHPSRIEESYGLLHIASGRRLTIDSMPTLIEAALWLRFVKDLTDWTQPIADLRYREDLRACVMDARKQALYKSASMRGDRHERMVQA